MIDSEFQKETKRLVLRQYKIEDYKIWRKTLLHLPPPQNPWDEEPRKEEELDKEKFLQILEKQKELREKDAFYEFTAFQKETGKMIGFVSIMDISRQVFQNGYLGYAVFSPYWRQGYGKEMVKAAVDIGFRTLRLHRLEAGIEPANIASIRLIKSLGFRKEGLSKGRLFLRGKWRDMELYAMTAEEWGVEGIVGHLMENRR
ncbi:MAG: N-acetyltransferase [Planctomycetota bacterium]|nr:MAG: N-acetyltransferase [Planctomycetota bacterium]